MEDEHKRSGMMTRAEWMAWLRESWAEAQGVAARGCSKGLHQAQGVAASCGKEWVGLTDDEIAQLMYKCDVIVVGPTQFDFARAIEVKLKEKNT